jgi:hypothetical protein
MRISLLIVFLLPFLHTSCKDYKPAEPTFFLEPSEIRVASKSGQGTGSHGITDLWLYVNGQFSGCYPVNSRLPVISKNRQAVIQLFAGIKNNGISSTRIPWAFYDLLRIDTFAESGSSFRRPITFAYNSAVTFTWIENCDGDPGLSLVRSQVSEANPELMPQAESFEGRSVSLALTPAQVIGQIETSADFGLPRYSPNVYLELNYKSNTSFVVGVIDQDKQTRAALVINPHAEWNKIYVQLAEPVSREPESSRFKVYFRVTRQEEPNPRIYLDNIKLMFIP